MKRLHGNVREVDQKEADRFTERTHAILEAYNVARFMDLPDEGKVAFLRMVKGQCAEDYPKGLPLVPLRQRGIKGYLVHKFWFFNPLNWGKQRPE